MENRTIKNLAEMDGRVYLYFSSKETKRRFMRQAANEGVTFQDGVCVMARPNDNIMALNHDMTVNFIGFAGNMAFRHPEAVVGDERLIRVDFQKYMDGENEYIL